MRSFGICILIIWLTLSIGNNSTANTNDTTSYSKNKKVITIFRISLGGSDDPATSETTDRVQEIAVEHINNDNTILDGYELRLKVLKASDSQEALQQAILVAQNYSDGCLYESANSTSFISPIVLGMFLCCHIYSCTHISVLK